MFSSASEVFINALCRVVTTYKIVVFKFGFEEGELIEEFGYPNQRFVLHTDKSADNVIIGTKVTVTVDRPLGR